MSPFDVRLATRTLTLSAIAALVVALVERITDERGVAAAGTGGRSIGVLPLMPVACAVAVLIALAPMTASGELRALASLGCSPWRARLPAIATASIITVVSAVSFAAGGADVAALFPPPVPAGDFRVENSSFVSDRRHIRISFPADGELLERVGPPPPSTASMPRDRKQVLGGASAIALAGIALSLWAASPSRRGAIRMLLTLTAWGASEVLVFQAAGARAVHPLLTALPSVALALLVIVEDRASQKLAREEAWI
jgi:hypothetical protein